MRLSLRFKLASIVLAATASLGFIAISGYITASRVTERLELIQRAYIPKVELRPSLEGEFDRLHRAIQDALAIQDLDALSQTQQRRDHFLELLANAGAALVAQHARDLRQALQEYYDTAVDYTRRSIAGETGEGLVEAALTLQAQEARVRSLITRATMLREHELDDVFSSAVAVQQRSITALFATSLVGLLLVVIIAIWLGRGVLRSVAELLEGFERFGGGAFDERIRLTHEDELSKAAAGANAMADNLRKLNLEQQAAEWLKSGLASLAADLRGELEVSEVGSRTARFVATYLKAPVAAIYATDGSEPFKRVGGYAHVQATPQPSTFKRGEGLLGQAALSESIVVVSDLPPNYLPVQSGLGESPPNELVLLPLLSSGRAIGVLELGVFRPWTEELSQFLLAIRETISIALQVSFGRASLRRLLEISEEHTRKLSAQEEELRAANEELQSQQEELRQANDDLTQQTRELENERRAAVLKNEELERARNDIEQKATELATVSAYKSQFLANMSHELRTPLNSMLLLSSLMTENQTGNLSSKQVDFCKAIHSSGTELLGLINQVLDLAKIESGRQIVTLEPVSIRSVLDQLRGTFEVIAQHKGIEFAIARDDDVPDSLVTDRARLVQVLNNLVANAIKFTEKGRVRVAVSVPVKVRFRREDLRAGTTVVVSVADTGIGIPLEHRERIFEPFEQGDPSTDRRFGGTGLGLAISRELATMLGGDIELESTLGTGSVFRLCLPLEVRTEATPIRSLRATEGRPSILVIEDDPNFAAPLRDLIQSQGVTCILAGDGENGLRLAKTSAPTGIVLDLRLPDMNGWDVMDRLRADPATAAIPVHVVSALEPGDRSRTMGAVGYVTKPCQKEDLERVIDSLIGEPPARVLIVEDDAVTGDSLVALLTRDRTSAKRVARAEEALEALAAERFHCIVLDLSLPGMDGLELLQLLEQRTDLEKPAIIVYTARSLSKEEVRRLETYAEAIVLKDGASIARLREEVALFTRRVLDGVPKKEFPATTSSDFRLDKRTILLVDDDMRTVYALSATLRARGAEVLVADTGLVALEVLNEHAGVIDGVLMDIMMPEMDGYAAMRRARQDPRFAKLPIIALTAKAMKGDDVKCIEAGATGYLPKPIDARRLFQMLELYLGKP